ncbi:MAG TPA: glycosyltransferase family 1 protein [Anaerolineae bacterium]|nr:glycosyltransferase family 1 protein [Anaerolineae bacterium]
MRPPIGIDYTSAVRQTAGIGRYTRELLSALLALDDGQQYLLFAAVGGLPAGRWPQERDRLLTLRPSLRFRTLPLSDDWMARLWHRLRLPLPVELLTGRLALFYSPDFVLPPTLPRTRTLLTVHDLSFIHYPDAFVPSLRRYLERVVPRSVARADLVLADSAATRADLIAHFGTPSAKIEVLYSGVDRRFRPEPQPGERDRLKARYAIGDEPYILTVGTLQPRKNYPLLIHAWAALADAPPLVIAGGKGWLYDEIFAAARRHGDRVRLIGFVDDADLPALYRHAALFAFPSLYEGFGLPVLEAMACGVPVVCADDSSLPEVAGEAARLVNPHDRAAWTAALARVLDDHSLRERMIAAGLSQAARFTWDRAARQLRSAFDRCLNL